jgi:outer membrane protein OmpA-like peptidoglycan-associated protein
MKSKVARLSVAVAASVMLAACTTQAPQEISSYRVGPEYSATGYIDGVRAYVYGEHTLLQYTHEPFFIRITDDYGQPVKFEKEGHYYRLDRAVSSFTVRTALLHLTHFKRLNVSRNTKARQLAQKPVAPTAVKTYATSSLPTPLKKDGQDKVQLQAELDALQKQLNTVRASIERGAPNADAIKALNLKLNEIQANLAHTSSTVIMVYFDLYKTSFEPKPEVASLLLSMAKNAELIKVRGRTDSIVAGPADGRIAKQRALAAQTYLISHGIASSKIQTSWQAAGDQIAPNTVKGKSLNRRVEIEIVTPPITPLPEVSNNKVANSEETP